MTRPDAASSGLATSHPAGPRGDRLALPLLAAAAIATLYLPSLDMGLIGDDFEWLNQSFAALHNPLRLLDRIVPFFRPLVKLSYIADWLIWGVRPVGFSLTTLLIHVVNVALLAAFAARVTGRRWQGFAVALLWGASAQYAEVTLWAAGRPDSLLAVFMLAVMVLAAGAHEEDRRWRWLALALALGAMGSKETWVVLPPLLTGLLVLVRRWSWRRSLTASAGIWVLATGYIAIFVAIPVITGGHSPTSYYSPIGPWLIVRKTAALLTSYAGLAGGCPGPWWSAGLGATGLAIGIAATRWLRSQLALWSVAWLLLTLLPSAPIEFCASRYNYLPLIGFWLAVTTLAATVATRLRLRFHLRRPTLVVLAAAAVVAILARHTVAMQHEIADYQRLAAAHSELVALTAPVLPLLDGTRPVVLVDQGRRRPIAEVDAALEGYPKVMFVRGDGLWQLIGLAPLVNVLGEPAERMLVRAPDNEVGDILARDPVVLVFTDRGFALAGAGAAEYLAQEVSAQGVPPAGVSGYRWTRWS